MASKQKKPLNGAKKYSLIAQCCTITGCDSEFYVSMPNCAISPKRFCLEHFSTKDKPTENKNRTLLQLLGLIPQKLEKQKVR